MRRIFMVFTLLALATGAHATELAGPLSGTLPMSGSPYLVTADIWVDAGESLLIEPGCELRFSTGTGFDVHGLLRAEGTEPSPISFQADVASWEGIDCFGANDCVFRHFMIRDANTGLHIFDGASLLEDGDIGPNEKNGLRIEADDVTARRLAIHDSQVAGYTALFIYQASPQIHDCEIWGTPGAAGVGVWGPAGPLLQNCEVRDCLSGITCVASTPTIDEAWIHDNGFAGNFDSGAGIYVGYAGSEPLVTNSLIEGNCFGVSVVLDGRINLGDLVNDFPGDDGLNRFVGNGLYDGVNRHLWNGTTNTLHAQNCFWAAADGVFTTDTGLIDGWIIDDDEGEGAAVLFEPLAEITAVPVASALDRWSSHPNPANPSFTLNGFLPRVGRLRLRLYTPAGRMAMELMDEAAPDGAFSRTFTTADLPSGLYLVRAELDGSILARSRLVILR
jgi:hypothetical protein